VLKLQQNYSAKLLCSYRRHQRVHDAAFHYAMRRNVEENERRAQQRREPDRSVTMTLQQRAGG
jgi:hypothetical protein